MLHERHERANRIAVTRQAGIIIVIIDVLIAASPTSPPSFSGETCGSTVKLDT
jgi:hypothetical protein